MAKKPPPKKPKPKSPPPTARPKKVTPTKEDLRALDQALDEIAKEGDTAGGLLDDWINRGA
jgi:hypothetical protein